MVYCRTKHSHYKVNIGVLITFKDVWPFDISELTENPYISVGRSNTVSTISWGLYRSVLVQQSFLPFSQNSISDV